ncbi:MAG: ATP-dependent DNA helicase RecG [Epsilonproteobacteria bacterium]|nr:ATP-dependent DNA helicase RecG [Campylobacterota bacterium]
MTMKFSKSPRINKALYDMGLYSFEDIIFHLPRKYDNLEPTREFGLRDKERVVFFGRVTRPPVSSRFSRAQVTRFSFTTKAGNTFAVEAWNRPYLTKMLDSESVYTLVANYDYYKNKLNMINLTKGEPPAGDYLRPVYTLPRAITNYQFSHLVEKAFDGKEEAIESDIPAPLQEKYRLLNKEKALHLVHRPFSAKDIYEGLRVLKYEECLLFSLKTQIIRSQNKELIKNEKQFIDRPKLKTFIRSLPYKLTEDQISSVAEIVKDMDQRSLMYRLLQGDVGTGKTLVAALAFYGNFLRNDQGALMAPTDALARQHFRTLRELFKDTPVRLALLLGATPKKERFQINMGLINHKIDVVVGTHALFSDDVTFSSLGLAVIDEQHRFGVNQRLLLASKGEHADLLLMSATPIPRTLALTLYGDLDVSTLTQFPFSQRKIMTKVVSNSDSLIHKTIKQAINSQQRVYVVAPVIDVSSTGLVSVEELFKYYEKLYPGQVSLLHGQMSIDDKNCALGEFISGKTPIIVSTSVIEVGIDVKEASAMVIYAPTSFGLASLHQLRGRIGRDGKEATCLLVYDGEDEDEINKLNVLVESNDGFFIAEEDLRRRGPGELSGLRQSGITNFEFVNLIDDFKMFEYARNDAKTILECPFEPSYRRIIARAKREIAQAKFTNV